MRNIGRFRYRISLQETIHTPNSIGASDLTYQEVKAVRADIRYTRYGGGGTKRNDGVNEYNLERIEFNLTPQAVKFEWTILFRGIRYEISAIQTYFDRTAIVCSGAPESNVDNEIN